MKQKKRKRRWITTKIKAIASICKQERIFWICQEKEEKASAQWLGDSAALYRLSKIQKLDKETIFTIFDIPARKTKKINVRQSPLPERFDFRDVVECENILEWEEISIRFEGQEFRPLRTCAGLKFINEKYLKPLSDVELGALKLYERTTKDGQLYIVAKNGFMVVAVILPCEVSERIGEKIKKLAQNFETTYGISR